MDQTKPLKDLFHFLELKKLKGYTTIMETHSKTHLKVKRLHDYYGNAQQDTFEGPSTYAEALLRYAKDLLP